MRSLWKKEEGCFLICNFVFLFILFIGIGIVYLNFRPTKKPSLNQNFEQFKKCLNENEPDFNISRLVTSSSNPLLYENLNYQWEWRIPIIQPIAFFVPVVQDDVVLAVKCGVSSGIQLLSRSGGHSLQKSSLGEGTSVIIDLREMNTIVINETAQTASIGTGAILSEIYTTLYENGPYFLPVGECPTVGIGGLALGGGYGNFARMYGLTTDQILKASIVVANGSVLELSNDNEAGYDLFWALQGAGSSGSFGIVTEIVFKILPIPENIAVGVLRYKQEEFRDLFANWQEMVKHLENLPNEFTATVSDATENFNLVLCEINGDLKTVKDFSNHFPSPKFYQEKFELMTFEQFILFGIKSFSGMEFEEGQLNSFDDIKQLQRHSNVPEYSMQTSFYVENIANGTEVKYLHDIVQKMPVGGGFSFELYGGAINNRTANETAFVHRGERLLYNFAISIGSKKLDHFEELQDWFNTMKNLTANVFNHTETYQNYEERELENFLKRYYGSNLNRLISIKKKYDPTNYFRNVQSIPTAISNYKYL